MRAYPKSTRPLHGQGIELNRSENATAHTQKYRALCFKKFVEWESFIFVPRGLYADWPITRTPMN